MLDSDLAQLYGVETKALNRQVRRNLIRFPADFMWQLTSEEYQSLKRQVGTSKVGRGGKQKQPLCFYRKWCRNAFKCSAVGKSCSRKYFNYENLYQAPKLSADGKREFSSNDKSRKGNKSSF